MMAVTVETKPAFKAGVPAVVFRGNYFSEFGLNWDISPDGKRSLMIKEAASFPSRGKINIVLNWIVLYSINAARFLLLPPERTVGRGPRPLDRPS
jgi:hypothetical protein